MYYQTRNQHGYLYYTALGLITIALFVIQSIPLLPRIAAVCAMPLLPLVFCIGVFNNEAVGFVFGLLAGLLMDITSSASDGFNALVLTVFGLGVALLTEYLFNDRLVTTCLLSFIFTAGYYLLYWLFFVVGRGYEGAGVYLVRFTLPAVIYTWVFTVPFYYLARYIRKVSLRERDEEKNRGFLR